MTDTWLENERGERIENVEVGEPIRLRAVVEARQDLSNPGFTLQARNDEGVIFEVSSPADNREEGIVMTAGSRATINATSPTRACCESARTASSRFRARWASVSKRGRTRR